MISYILIGSPLEVVCPGTRGSISLTLVSSYISASHQGSAGLRQQLSDTMTKCCLDAKVEDWGLSGLSIIDLPVYQKPGVPSKSTVLVATKPGSQPSPSLGPTGRITG